MRHPRWDAGKRAVGLQNDHQLYAAMFEAPGNRHRLAASWMEPIIDPTFNNLFLGSMSPFRAGLGSL
jgi:hypothetical protein